MRLRTVKGGRLKGGRVMRLRTVPERCMVSKILGVTARKVKLWTPGVVMKVYRANAHEIALCECVQ